MVLCSRSGLWAALLAASMAILFAASGYHAHGLSAPARVGSVEVAGKSITGAPSCPVCALAHQPVAPPGTLVDLVPSGGDSRPPSPLPGTCFDQLDRRALSCRAPPCAV